MFSIRNQITKYKQEPTKSLERTRVALFSGEIIAFILFALMAYCSMSNENSFAPAAAFFFLYLLVCDKVKMLAIDIVLEQRRAAEQESPELDKK